MTDNHAPPNTTSPIREIANQVWAIAKELPSGDHPRALKGLSSRLHEIATKAEGNAPEGKCNCWDLSHPKPPCPKHGPPENPTWERLYKEAEAALARAQVAIDDIAGWSGSSGNWPLQESSGRVRVALQALRGPLCQGVQLHHGDVVQHRRSKMVGRVDGFAPSGTDVIVDGTGPYPQADLIKLVPEFPYGEPTT